MYTEGQTDNRVIWIGLKTNCHEVNGSQHMQRLALLIQNLISFGLDLSLACFDAAGSTCSCRTLLSSTMRERDEVLTLRICHLGIDNKFATTLQPTNIANGNLIREKTSTMINDLPWVNTVILVNEPGLGQGLEIAGCESLRWGQMWTLEPVGRWSQVKHI